MKTIADEIRSTVHRYASHLRSAGSSSLEEKATPGKWSKKEILGHLVDSAQNNLQRFVRGQYEHVPHIVYDQDNWVSLQRYQTYNTEELIGLWVALNDHLARTLACMEPANFEKMCNTGKSGEELHSLKFIAEDYVAHLKHHLNQIQADH